MKTIWKFQFEIADVIEIDMPKVIEILHFEIQGDVPCIWAIVNPVIPLKPKQFRLFGTGHPIREDNLKYIGTSMHRGGELVWHLFEVKEE